MRIIFKHLSLCCLMALSFSCGNNNNQSEGAADNDDAANAASTATQPGAVSNEAESTTTDTVVKAPNSEPGEGSNISGTGVNNGSGKTGGG